MLLSKHIAAYLPYNVFAAQARSGKTELYRIYGLRHSIKYDEWIVSIDDSRHGDYQAAYLKGITLALRPVEDLSKDSFIHNTIEVKPKEVLSHLDLEWLLTSSNPYRLIGTLNLKDIEILLSWHIDVFGLIKTGGAINMHTLQE